MTDICDIVLFHFRKQWVMEFVERPPRVEGVYTILKEHLQTSLLNGSKVIFSCFRFSFGLAAK